MPLGKEYAEDVVLVRGESFANKYFVGDEMSNSRRWREFITWWGDMEWQFKKQMEAKHLVEIINQEINEIKKNKNAKRNKTI